MEWACGKNGRTQMTEENIPLVTHQENVKRQSNNTVENIPKHINTRWHIRGDD